MIWLVKWLHLSAAVFWIGGMLFISMVLAPRLGEIKSGPERMRLVSAIGTRFRNISWVAIGVLLITGITNLTLRGVDWSQLSQTDFGRHLMIKLTAVLAMLLLSAIHDFGLGPRATQLGMRGGGPEFLALRRRVTWLARINLLLGIFVIFLAVGLT